jgi:hypothetical protein
MASTTVAFKDVMMFGTALESALKQVTVKVDELIDLKQLSVKSTVHFHIEEQVEVLPSGGLRLLYACEGVETPKIPVEILPEEWTWKDRSRPN